MVLLENDSLPNCPRQAMTALSTVSDWQSLTLLLHHQIHGFKENRFKTPIVIVAPRQPLGLCHCRARELALASEDATAQYITRSDKVLSPDKFLSELTRLFHKSKSAGSLSLTMKRYDGRTKPKPRKGRPQPPEPTEYKCIVRASLGSKKISTVINQKDVNKFQLAYANVLKANMDGLKKKEKTKGKSKAKTKAT